ncbi:MAG: NADH:flavin oxidoreductase [Acidobacteriota bacterium]|nr:NADH:flavin oxidoreductase [Acidobacteriota bacterium]
MPEISSRSPLFAPIKIGAVEIANRFVRAATHEFMADASGGVADRLVLLMGDLAQGEVGLIITGHAYVRPDGIASPRQTAVYDDRFIPALARIPDAVHRTSARIFLQISHSGRQTKAKMIGGLPISPSAVFEPAFGLMPREMSAADVPDIREAFLQAARRARDAGFDGVQVHCAHGYLLSSFLSPHTNRRTDDWGGTTAKRARLAVEIVAGIKEICGRDFPVIAKLNSTDFLPGGLDLEESLEIAGLLEAAGLDALEISGGMTEAGRGSVWEGVRAEKDEGYFVDAAARFKKALRIPVAGLGGNRTLAHMEAIVREGRADLVSMSRPLVREPGLVRAFRLGQTAKSACISCNKCFNPRGLSCGDLRISRHIPNRTIL